MHLEVVAVAARKLEDAKEFAGKHGIAKAYGDYAGLASDPDIDVVLLIYIWYACCLVGQK